MSEARALTNLIGNGVATVVVAKWVDQLDHKQLTDTLAGRNKENKASESSI
ncbi:Aerobic C4-dicarboxylate transport protein [Pantoea agglomerans]|nr:Aerobic C4-dicarboxylate transport protein [Pantoea agglomerans]